MIPHELLEQVRGQTDLPAIVQEFGISLRRTGRGYTGRCPFHADKTPSFSVSLGGTAKPPLYNCFACGAAGDVLDFVMNIAGLSFPDAVEHVAQRTGIALPVFSNAGGVAMRQRSRAPRPARTGPTAARREPQLSDEDVSLRSRVYGYVIERMATDRHGNRRTGERALGLAGREYLASRLIDPESAGWHGFRSLDNPQHWARLGQLLNDRFTVAELVAAGFWAIPENKTHAEWAPRWGGRVPALLIPYWHDGAVVGLRFRRLDQGPGKYNTLPGAQPHVPYNASPALDALHSGETVHVCEGELNAHTLLLHEERAIGVPGVNNWQSPWARWLRPAGRVVLWYDNDPKPDGTNPGQKGMQRVVDALAAALGRAWLTRVVQQPLPAGTDINDIHRQGTLDVYLEKLRTYA